MSVISLSRKLRSVYLTYWAEVVLIEHNVSCEDFEIFIDYDKSQFEHQINEFVRNIIKEPEKSDLYRHGVASPPHEYFPHYVIISFTVN